MSEAYIIDAVRTPRGIELPKREMKHAYDDKASLKGRKFVPAKY